MQSRGFGKPRIALRTHAKAAESSTGLPAHLKAPDKGRSGEILLFCHMEPISSLMLPEKAPGAFFHVGMLRKYIKRVSSPHPDMGGAKRHSAEFLQLLESGPGQAACPHVADGCGGCLMQQYDYAAQVAAKEAYLAKLYARDVHVVPCPDPLGYRNRMDFVAAFGMMGLRQRGHFARVVDIKDCLLLPEHAREAYKAVREELAGVEDYHYLRHEGFLRYCTVRTSQTTGETLLIFTTTTPQDLDAHREFQHALERLKRRTGATGICWTVNDAKSDIPVGEPYWHIGRPWIIDEIGGLRFRVGPKTFFQANTLLAGRMFLEATAFASGQVLDLYCGVGVIGCIAARNDDVHRVVGVDVVTESIEAARENAVLNGITKCQFVHADAATYLKQAEHAFDTVICDPARPGLGKEACDMLLALSPRRIIYISCNPRSHLDDLALLSAGYEMTALKGYDLFPQTPHVEVLSVLERKA